MTIAHHVCLDFVGDMYIRASQFIRNKRWSKWKYTPIYWGNTHNVWHYYRYYLDYRYVYTTLVTSKKKTVKKEGNLISCNSPNFWGEITLKSLIFGMWLLPSSKESWRLRDSSLLFSGHGCYCKGQTSWRLNAFRRNNNLFPNIIIVFEIDSDIQLSSSLALSLSLWVSLALHMYVQYMCICFFFQKRHN